MSMKTRFNIVVIAEDVVDYVFTIAKNMPKTLRSDIVPSVRNYALSILDNVTRANLTNLKDARRLHYQEEAKVNIDILSSISYLCKRNGYVTTHQLDVLGDKLLKLYDSVDKWIASDRNRLTEN